MRVEAGSWKLDVGSQMMMQAVQPFYTVDWLPDLNFGLLRVLLGLSPEAWATAALGRRVLEVVAIMA